jgi:hypothetical protein
MGGGRGRVFVQGVQGWDIGTSSSEKMEKGK